MIVVWLILLSKWHRHISSSPSSEDLSDVTFHVLIKRHRVLDKTYLLSSFPWPPLLGHAPHVSLSYVSEVLRRLPMPSCLDLAITDIVLRAILYSVTFTDSQNKTCFRNFPEGCTTPSYPYQSSFSCSQQAFPAAISCFCFLHITPVLYGHTVRNNINFHWSEPGYRSVLFVRSKPFVLFIIRWTNLATVTYFTYHTRHSSGISASWWPIFPAFLALALTFLKETNFSHRHWHCSSSHCKLSLGPFHGHFHDAIPRDSVFAWTCHLASRVPYQWSHVEQGSFFIVVSNLFILVLVCFGHVC